MACAIEDAGFEIRDSIHWVYGSGFPKSHNVSKGIDRKRYKPSEVLEVTAWIRKALAQSGRSNAEMLKAFGFNDGSGSISHWTAATIGSQPTVPTLEQVPLLLDLLGHTVETVPPRIGHLLLELNGRKGQPGAAWYDREVTGHHKAGNPIGVYEEKVGNGTGRTAKERRDNSATDDARKWEGWGTALKPAHEPIVMARKPFTGTVAQNVLEHGTGAINIDGTRIGSDGGTQREGKGNAPNDLGWTNMRGHGIAQLSSGRWPANVILTHSIECKQIGESAETYGGGAKASSGFVSGYGGEGFVGTNGVSTVWKCMPDCPAREIDQQSGMVKGGTWNQTDGARHFDNDGKATNYSTTKTDNTAAGASRYFAQPEWSPGDYLASIYTPKAGKKERNAGLDGMPKLDRYKPGGVGGTVGKRSVDDAVNAKPVGNHHPTVKPVALMRYLIRLVTPPGGTVLDPFLGSGTTAVAAILEKFEWIGCELTAEYLPIIAARTANAANDYPATNTIQNPDNTTQTQMGLFDRIDQ